MEDYLDNNEDEDFMEDETIYDDYDFETKEEELKGTLLGVDEPTISPPAEKEPSITTERKIPANSEPQKSSDNLADYKKGNQWNQPPSTQPPKFKSKCHLLSKWNMEALTFSFLFLMIDPKTLSHSNNELASSSHSELSQPPAPVVEPPKVWSNPPKSIIFADHHKKGSEDDIYLLTYIMDETYSFFQFPY